MKRWGLEVLLIMLLVVCGYLLLTDVRNALETQQHYQQMKQTTDYYTDLFQKHRAEQTNNPALPVQRQDN